MNETDHFEILPDRDDALPGPLFYFLLGVTCAAIAGGICLVLVP